MSSAEENLQPDDAQSAFDVRELKRRFATYLREPDHLRKPEGLATGLNVFDRFLSWGGLPKGALSLFCGSLGTGATSLWLEAAAHVTHRGCWAAWVNHDTPLSPLSLHHKGMNLQRFVTIEPAMNEGSQTSINQNKLFWLLQELMSSSLFELIGCDLGRMRLKEHQIRKLQAQARDAHVALVFISQLHPATQFFRSGSMASVFSLIATFEKRRILIERALHRPTPHAFSRSVNYARFTLHTGDRIGLGTDLHSSDHTKLEPGSVPQTSGTSDPRGV